MPAALAGIDCALVGRLGRPPEARTTKAGNPMLILNLAVDEGDSDAPATWVKALVFGDDGIAGCRDLEPGARVYVEGRLKAEAYTPRDGGEPRVGLTVLCRVAQLMGRIGRKRPARAPQRGDGAPGAATTAPDRIGPQRAGHRPRRAPTMRRPRSRSTTWTRWRRSGDERAAGGREITAGRWP